MDKIYKIDFEWDKRGNSPYVSFWGGEEDDKKPAKDNERFLACFAAHGGDFSLIKSLAPTTQYTVLNSKSKPYKTDKYCDFPYSSGFGVLMSAHAAECLKYFLGKDAYLHPVIHYETGDHYLRAFATQFVKGLINLDESDYKLFESGRIKQINSISLNKGVAFPDIFKLAESPRGDIYFSEAFVNRYHECGLTGVEFIDVTK